MWRQMIAVGVVSTLLLPQSPAGRVHEQDAETMIRSTCMLLYAAVSAEDSGLIQSLLYAPRDRDQTLAAAQARRIVASVRFQRATEGKLPAPESARLYEQFRIVVPSDFLSFVMAEWQVAGDQATGKLAALTFEQQQIPPLINVRGIWKINLLPDATDIAADALAAVVEKQTTVVERTAAMLSEGKLRTIDDVGASLRDAPSFAPSNYVPDIVLMLPPGLPK